MCGVMNTQKEIDRAKGADDDGRCSFFWSNQHTLEDALDFLHLDQYGERHPSRIDLVRDQR